MGNHRDSVLEGMLDEIEQTLETFIAEGQIAPANRDEARRQLEELREDRAKDRSPFRVVKLREQGDRGLAQAYVPNFMTVEDMALGEVKARDLWEHELCERGYVQVIGGSKLPVDPERWIRVDWLADCTMGLDGREQTIGTGDVSFQALELFARVQAANAQTAPAGETIH